MPLLSFSIKPVNIVILFVPEQTLLGSKSKDICNIRCSSIGYLTPCYCIQIYDIRKLNNTVMPQYLSMILRKLHLETAGKLPASRSPSPGRRCRTRSTQSPGRQTGEGTREAPGSRTNLRTHRIPPLLRQPSARASKGDPHCEAVARAHEQGEPAHAKDPAALPLGKDSREAWAVASAREGPQMSEGFTSSTPLPPCSPIPPPGLALGAASLGQ